MTPRPLPLLVLPALLAGLSVLAACGDDPTPRHADPTSSAPVTTSDPPTTSPPTSTPPAHETAAQFIRRFVAAENRMQSTGKTRPYIGLTQDCFSCKQVANRVIKIYSSGGYISSNGERVLQVSQYQSTAADVYRVRLHASLTRYQVRAGGPVKSYPGGDVTRLFNLIRVDGRWAVDESSVLDES